MRKIISLILVSALFLALTACGLDVQTPDSYEELLFDTSKVHSIDIVLSEEDLSDLIDNPREKTKYHADITIDGELVEDVAFATKGNSTLQLVANMGDSVRYSFKVSFGKFVEGQTYHGLHKLNLLNLFSDATYMKDYISYSMFRRMGVPAPLASYVWLKINGEVQGLYLAVEEIDDAFADRNFGGAGSIYKPEPADIVLDGEAGEQLRDGVCVYVDNVNGADLVYRGDDEALYTDIFDNAECLEEGSHERVIEAMRCLSEMNELETHLYTDEVIGYFAVHNYLVNYDSYTGRMLHNFYLYENGGRLMMLPWDYDQIFGGFAEDGIISHVSDPVRVINRGIYSPLNDTADEERPMWNWILQNETYLDKYREMMDELISSYYESGEFERETQAVYDLIRPYVEQDPTAFVPPKTFDEAYNMFRYISLLRAHSIRLQLDGELAPVTGEQAEADRVDVSDVDIMLLKGQ